MPRERDRVLAREIVERLRMHSPEGGDVFLELERLDNLPPDVVRAALEPWVGAAPDVARLDEATRRALRLPAPPLVLRTVSVTKDADVLDLGPVAEEQLRVAGKSWDGLDLAPEERLDGEIEGSFAGTLEHRVLADAETGAAVFDVVRFHGDAGVVFAAGSVVPIALLADGRVETRDRRVQLAVEEALREEAEAKAEAKTTTSKRQPSAKNAGTKKPSVKKTATKKTAAKKTAASKPSAKKATAKKTATSPARARRSE